MGEDDFIDEFMQALPKEFNQKGIDAYQQSVDNCYAALGLSSEELQELHKKQQEADKKESK